MLSIRRTWHDDALKSVNFPDNTNKARCVHSNKSLKKKKKRSVFVTQIQKLKLDFKSHGSY